MLPVIQEGAADYCHNKEDSIMLMTFLMIINNLDCQEAAWILMNLPDVAPFLQNEKWVEYVCENT